MAGAGLRLGDVVQQRRQLEDGAPGVAVAGVLGEVGVRRRRPGRQRVDGVVAMAGGNRLGVLHAVQQVSQHIPIVMGAGLGAVAGGFQLGDDAAEQAQAVEDFQHGAGAVGRQQQHKFVAHSFRRHLFQQRGVLPDAPGR